MTNLNGKPLQDPRLYDVLQQLKSDIFLDMNCVKIGIIQEFFPITKTAIIKIAFKRTLPDGTVANYPLLVDCPIFTNQGGGGYLTLPVQAGDFCILLFSDRNIDAWFKIGGDAVPYDGRCHSLSDGMALVGVNPLGGGPLYAIGEALFSYEGAKFGIKNGKLTIQNAALLTLLTAMTGLIDTVKGISTIPGGGPLNAASLASLEAYKATFQALLY